MDRFESLLSMFLILDGNNYALWSNMMQTYLLSIEVDVWLSVENGYTKPKSRPKGSARKKLHRDNAKAISAIMSGLSKFDKNKLGQCMTAKEIWNRVQSL